MNTEIVGPSPQKRLDDVIAAAKGLEEAIIEYGGGFDTGPCSYRPLDHFEENYVSPRPLHNNKGIGVMNVQFARQVKTIVAAARNHHIVPSVEEHRLVIWMLSRAFPSGVPTFSFSGHSFHSPKHWPSDVITPNKYGLFSDQSGVNVAREHQKHKAQVAWMKANDDGTGYIFRREPEPRFLDKISASLDPVLSCLGLGRGDPDDGRSAIRR